MLNSLIVELVFYVLFLYFFMATFVAEFFNGLLQTFVCVFGWTTIQDNTDGSGNNSLLLQPYYYSYVIMLSLAGNIVFFISMLIYGPVIHSLVTRPVHTTPATAATAAAATASAAADNNSLATRRPPMATMLAANNMSAGGGGGGGTRLIYLRKRPVFHVCLFTRYDLYGLLVLVFIGSQYMLQWWASVDDFKPVEGMIFMNNIDYYKNSNNNDNKSQQQTNCFVDGLCDDLTGQQALRGIHQFQQDSQCCGWIDATDWLPKNACKYHSLPASCCSRLAADTNCSLANPYRFPTGCHQFQLPVRNIIDPTRYSDHCYGLYPIFKLLAIISYQFSFKRLFNGSAFLIHLNLYLPAIIPII